MELFGGAFVALGVMIAPSQKKETAIAMMAIVAAFFGSMPFRMELDITGIYGLGDPEVAGRVAMGWVASS